MKKFPKSGFHRPSDSQNTRNRVLTVFDPADATFARLKTLETGSHLIWLHFEEIVSFGHIGKVFCDYAGVGILAYRASFAIPCISAKCARRGLPIWETHSKNAYSLRASLLLIP